MLNFNKLLDDLEKAHDQLTSTPQESKRVSWTSEPKQPEKKPLQGILKVKLNPNYQQELRNPPVPLSDEDYLTDFTQSEYSNSSEEELDEDLELEPEEEMIMTPPPMEASSLSFQNVSLDDYDNIDDLMNLLDRFLKKSNKTAPEPTTTSPLQALPPNFTLPDGSDTDSDDEPKQIPVTFINLIHRLLLILKVHQ